MARVYLSLGSNIERYRHIGGALDALSARYGELQISPVFRSEAVGFVGDDFLNLVVGLDTAQAVGELARELRAIEDDYGRQRGGPRFSPRTLDIDILTYDDLVGMIDGVELPREEILFNAFVLKPLALLAPDVMHPVARRSYADLWRDYDQASQRLWQVDFRWRDRDISVAEG